VGRGIIRLPSKCVDGDTPCYGSLFAVRLTVLRPRCMRPHFWPSGFSIYRCVHFEMLHKRICSVPWFWGEWKVPLHRCGLQPGRQSPLSGNNDQRPAGAGQRWVDTSSCCEVRWRKRPVRYRSISGRTFGELGTLRIIPKQKLVHFSWSRSRSRMIRRFTYGVTASLFVSRSAYKMSSWTEHLANLPLPFRHQKVQHATLQPKFILRSYQQRRWVFQVGVWAGSIHTLSPPP